MIDIRFEAEKFRTAAYDTEKDNFELGFCAYKEKDGYWYVDRSLVDSNYGGQGIAGRLLDELVKQARKKGKKLFPACSYVRHTFEKNPDKYADIIVKTAED